MNLVESLNAEVDAGAVSDSTVLAQDSVVSVNAGAQNATLEQASAKTRPRRDPKPAWLKVRAPGGENYTKLKQTLRELDLYTVCEEARCPNVGECWASGTATMMLLGHTCTRGCRFCAVTTGNPMGAVDPREPEHVARAISKLSLRYIVLTMVDRDDLLDGGAEHVARTVKLLKELRPDLLVETLVGDFRGRLWDVETVLSAAPDVYAHNIEVPRRITPLIRDKRCSYDVSLEVLRHAKEQAPQRLTKSSLMVGIGETDDEIIEAMRDLRQANVDVLTIGQYLRPTEKHAALDRYVTEEKFEEFRRIGMEMGFAYVASGPLVRSSYHAAEAFISSQMQGRAPSTADSAAPAVGALQTLAPGGSGPTKLELNASAMQAAFVPASRLVRKALPSS
jgi:lipoic acid synthetase